MDQNKLRAILLIIVSIGVSLYLGVSAATSQLQTAAWVVGVSFFLLCFSLGQRIWLFCKFLGAIGLVIYYLPGKPDTIQIGQFVLITFAALLFLSRRLIYKINFGEMEIWSLLFIACVAQAYVRNPVGLDVLGSSKVGGRPYLDFLVALVSSFIISSLIVDAKQLRWYYKLTMIGMMLSAFLGALGYYFPRVGYWLGSSSGEGLDESVSSGPENSVVVDRKSFAGVLGKAIALYISSNRSPLVSLIHPLYAGLILISVIVAAYSGFRNQLAMVGLTYVVGIFYRNGVAGVFISSIFLAVGVIVASVVNMILPLPPTIQRAMTIFPGSWEQRYVDDTEGSTEWRTEMWIEALTNKRYINSTLMGDGLGMTKGQLDQSIALTEMKNDATTSGFNVHRENALISGAYHSGPVSMVRTCGYIGLLVWVCAIFVVVKHAHRLISNSRGTEWYALVLFFAIPIVWGPFFWIFIYGTFSGGAVMLFASIATIRLLSSNLGIETHYKKSRNRTN